MTQAKTMTQAEAMRRYNLTIRAIVSGDETLRACEDEERDARYPAYLALFARLPEYVQAAGWLPVDPWEGYDNERIAAVTA